MADSKKETENRELVNTDVAPKDTPVVVPAKEVVAEETPSRPDLQLLGGDFTLKDGENLYFFPEIQKSVVAKSLDAATKQVKAELDALNKSEEDK